MQLTTERQRLSFLVASALIVASIIGSLDPISQDPSYHRFADELPLMHVPNWQNVLSNLPFAIVGILGIMSIGSSKLKGYAVGEQKTGWIIFFFGVLMTALGSGYYHWRPDNWGLFWDRLPMTIGFSGLFASIIGERVSNRAYQFMLWPLVALGLLSVVYWIMTEESGAGDLRPYAFVQFYPILAIPCLIWLCPARFTHAGYIGIAIGCYILAKICEDLDQAIWAGTGELTSGHALKHLWAALGCYFLLKMLQVRRHI
jgi:hypothetical protein